MAHRILGIDLGAYSVKVVVMNASFRKSSVLDWLEQPVPPGPEPFEERAAHLLGSMLRARGVNHDVSYAAFGGEVVSMRVLDFPFVGLKRADLDKAVGAELEGQLPHDLDDIVYAYDILAKPAEESETKRPAPGTRLLAAATRRDKVARLLEVMQGEQLEPHALIAAPAAYARPGTELATDPGESLLLIDHGHARTNVAILRGGRVVFARTIARGGRHVTQAVARAWGMNWADAERAKHTDGFVASSREPAPSDAWARISEVLRVEFAPLVRELRQTLAACRAQTHVVAQRVVLAGGGSRLKGLANHLADELELPVGLLDADAAARLLGPTGVAREVPADIALLALGAALEGASGRPAFDLRQGPLAYKQSFTFLRAKAGVLVASGLLVALFFAGNAYAALYKLRSEHEILEKRLETETTEVFGAPVSAADLQAKIAPKKDESPLPKMTAFDILVDMSKHLPDKKDGKIDVVELEIEPKKIFLKMVADSSATIDSVAKKFKEIDCFQDIQKPREDTVPDGKQVSITIASKCM